MSLEYQEEQNVADLESERTVGQPSNNSTPIYTLILIGCIAAVFVVQFITSKDPSFVAIDRYSAYFAGFDKHAFIEGHQYWRILTGATVHSGVLHVLMNGYALYIFGRLFETLSN